jgi:hypothetical protein
VSSAPENFGKAGGAERKINRITPVSTTPRPPPFPKTPVSGQRLNSVWAETSNERVSIGFGETEAARMFWQRLKLFAGFCV